MIPPRSPSNQEGTRAKRPEEGTKSFQPNRAPSSEPKTKHSEKPLYKTHRYATLKVRLPLHLKPFHLFIQNNDPSSLTRPSPSVHSSPYPTHIASTLNTISRIRSYTASTPEILLNSPTVCVQNFSTTPFSLSPASRSTTLAPELSPSRSTE